MEVAPSDDVERHPAARARLVEVAVVLITGLVTIGGTAAAAEHQGHGAIGVGGVVLLALAVLALPFRHRYPVGTLSFVLATSLAYWSLGNPKGPIFLPLIIALFQVVLTGHRRAAITALVIGFLGFLWLGYIIGRNDPPKWGPSIALAAWLIALLSVSELVRSRRDRAAERARTHSEELRRRATDERMQIARDLHDAVAHNMSLINIQASVALHLMAEEPEQATRALTTIKAASKEALVELRSILGVLRQVDADAPRSPTPSLVRLDDLVTTAEASGVDVTVDVDGDLSHLPRQTDARGVPDHPGVTHERRAPLRHPCRGRADPHCRRDAGPRDPRRGNGVDRRIGPLGRRQRDRRNARTGSRGRRAPGSRTPSGPRLRRCAPSSPIEATP